MRAALACALLLVLGGFDADARPKPKPKRPVVRRTSGPPAAAGPGQITYATATTAYVNRGRADGLTTGTGLVVTREGRLAGKCTITAASDHWATCAIEGMKVGDRIAVERRPPAAVPSPPAVPDPAELMARRARLEAAAIPPVDFSGGGAGLLGREGRIASLALSHQSFVDFATSRRFDVQRIDLAVYDVEIWRGIHASADLTVLNFSQRPADHRTPLGGASLLVRELEISYHRPDFPLLAQLGRTWVRRGPGFSLLDGAQAAWRSADGTIEAGAYGGLLPDPTSLGISTRRFGAGAFLMARFASGRGSKASLLQLEARVGYAERFPLAGRLEVGAAAHAWLAQRFDAHLSVELGFFGAQAPALIDAARLDFGWRPTDRVRLFVSGRYDGAGGFDVVETGVASGDWQSLRTEAGLTVVVTEGLWLGASGGASADLLGGPTEAWVGPELTLPHVTSWAAVAINYREELGWLRGRSASVQLTVTPISRLRVLARASWMHEQGTAGAGGLTGQELGGALMVDLAITRWLWLRASAAGRGAVLAFDGTPASANVLAQIGGQL